MKLFVKGCRRFSGKTCYRQTVRAVGCDFKFSDGIVQTDCLVNIGAGHTLAVFPQNENAVFDGVGKIVFRQSQFGKGAEHTVAFNASELAFDNMLSALNIGIVQRNGDKVAHAQVLRAGNNLQIFSLSGVNHADPHMIGIRMTRQRKNFTDNNVFQIFSFVGDALDF